MAKRFRLRRWRPLLDFSIELAATGGSRVVTSLQPELVSEDSQGFSLQFPLLQLACEDSGPTQLPVISKTHITDHLIIFVRSLALVG